MINPTAGLLLLLAAACCSATTSLLYNTTSGLHRAQLIRVHDKLVAKLSFVPYAEKPAKFRHSVLKRYVPGEHQNLENIVCHQAAEMTMYGMFQIKKAGRMVEDCLTITVYIPLNVTREGPLASVMHIHGGSNFVGGSGLFDGSILAAHGEVIVAVINYRLGILGFLSDGTSEYPGNFGLKDQVLALKWLRLNCQVLNCDIERITLWGKWSYWALSYWPRKLSRFECKLEG